jgi:hypothetical protein
VGRHLLIGGVEIGLVAMARVTPERRLSGTTISGQPPMASKV